MCLVKISTVTKAGPGTKSSSGSSGSRGITRHRRLVIKNVKQKEYKRTQSLPLHCFVSPTGPGPLLWTSAAPQKSTKAHKEANLMCLEKETAVRLARPRSSHPAPQSAAADGLVMGVLKNCGFGGPCSLMRVKTACACCA